jgi:hypothetical protein
MLNPSPSKNQIQSVSNFIDFISTPFQEDVNAICWKRELKGDFLEIIKKAETTENITVLNEQELLKLELSEQGQLARDIILNDYHLLKEHGALPTLNIIKYYERDEDYTFFPTDVYSFHVDRSPIPTNTILCTYYGASSDILPNSQAQQKIFVPEIREELKKQFKGTDEEFESYLMDNFFDLHYQEKPDAQLINLGLGNLWRLEVDHPESQVLPCIHRAPKENTGENRLLLIC